MGHPYWPLFDLELRTERLVLAPMTDEHLVQLVGLIGKGIHPPDEMPFSVPWTRGSSPDRERSALQYHWGTRAEMKPEKWDLQFGVWHEGLLVGCQGLVASDFAISRTVQTGSWLVSSAQGNGIGKEMRNMVLHFAFETLGAEVATTDAWDWNVKSRGVTESLGYSPNGESVVVADGKAGRMMLYRLAKDDWRAKHGDSSVIVTGADNCLAMLGAE